jgi:BirA family transcriptional regulator, biotin operon repressor / biotin---[acetyl-CoA-carboxylase] ligase
MSRSQLINILADGEFHSGESLGRALGVSRAAIWKRLQVLSSLGISVESVRGLGYRISGGLCLLDSDLIAASISPGSHLLMGRLICLDEVDSTNQYLLSSVGKGDICLAERQTAGRGRRGRHWVSPYGSNVCLSLRWQYEQGVMALEGLSLAIGVLLLDVLSQDFGVSGLQLKWPNDLLLGELKLGGVLIEVGGDLTGDCAVVVGVGINVKMASSEGKSISQPWTDLAQCGVQIDRNVLCAHIISRLLPALESFPESGFTPYRARWLERAAYLGRRVVITTPSRSVGGVMLGVDHVGGLIVDVDGAPQIFSGGEVSLRST